MTFALVSKYEVGEYDTVESISSSYGVSWPAIKDIPANQHLKHRLPDSGKVETGLLLSIAPHAGRLVRDRLHALQRLRPLVMSHFQRLAERADTELRPILEVSSRPMNASAVQDKMDELERDAAREIEALAVSAQPLVGICAGMAHTHVATATDRQAAASAGDSLCGLYCAVPPEKFQVWRDLWLLQTWSGRWAESDGSDAWDALQQFTNTVRSIVVQSIDVKIRFDQGLERRLLGEFRDPSSG